MVEVEGTQDKSVYQFSELQEQDGGRKRRTRKHHKKSKRHHKKSRKHSKKSKKHHKRSKRHHKKGGSILGLTAAEATPIVLGVAAAIANNKLPPRVNNLVKKTPVLKRLANKVKGAKSKRR